MSSLAKKVSGLRTARGMSRRDLASKLGGSVSVAANVSKLQQIESGSTKNPTMNTVVALAIALDTTTDILSGREDQIVAMRVKDALAKTRKASKTRRK